MPPCSAAPSKWGRVGGRLTLQGTLTGVLDCSVSFCSHIFRRLSRSLSSCSLKLRSRSSFFSLSRVASISHLHRNNWFKSQLCSRGILNAQWSIGMLNQGKRLKLVLLNQRANYQRITTLSQPSKSTGSFQFGKISSKYFNKALKSRGSEPKLYGQCRHLIKAYIRLAPYSSQRTTTRQLIHSRNSSKKQFQETVASLTYREMGK